MTLIFRAHVAACRQRGPRKSQLPSRHIHTLPNATKPTRSQVFLRAWERHASEHCCDPFWKALLLIRITQNGRRPTMGFTETGPTSPDLAPAVACCVIGLRSGSITAAALEPLCLLSTLAAYSRLGVTGARESPSGSVMRHSQSDTVSRPRAAQLSKHPGLA
jgi:hypothetical protein